MTLIFGIAVTSLSLDPRTFFAVTLVAVAMVYVIILGTLTFGARCKSAELSVDESWRYRIQQVEI